MAQAPMPPKKTAMITQPASATFLMESLGAPSAVTGFTSVKLKTGRITRLAVSKSAMAWFLARRSLDRVHRHGHSPCETGHDFVAWPEHLGDAVAKDQNLVDHAKRTRSMRNDDHRRSALLELQNAVGQRGIAIGIQI